MTTTCRIGYFFPRSGQTIEDVEYRASIPIDLKDTILEDENLAKWWVDNLVIAIGTDVILRKTITLVIDKEIVGTYNVSLKIKEVKR